MVSGSLASRGNHSGAGGQILRKAIPFSAARSWLKRLMQECQMLR
ncbi:hypothetical protein HMPREF1862_00439 [Varibaculum cambriense]|uniref:Uncharacterized protein n=1 Tax=Varibaculum cambriense TaxID=184870 RepID=A0AB34X180_9ACTO|nr:hypothetical protein HMPREF1862_00439 [Varibaculum cambriense]